MEDKERKRAFDGVSPKFTFTFGLLIGISIISTAAFFTILFVNLGSGEASGEVVTNTNVSAGDSVLSTTNLKSYAKTLGLDTKKFNSCLDDKTYSSQVSSDMAYGNQIGVGGTPAFFINGKYLSGAQSIENFKEIIDKELAGTGSENFEDYSATLQSMAASDAFSPVTVDVQINEADPVWGNQNAAVTIVEFSDFECSFCARAYLTIKSLESQYSGKIKIVFKQFPLSFHNYANGAANASLCALEQGKFWEYHDKLFTANQ